MSWNIKRLFLSAFVIFHLTVVVLWIVPHCELKRRFVGYFTYYMLPLGQWQYWGMFAPNPFRDTVALEAMVRDAKGMLHVFAFPKERDFPRWKSFFLFRHAKYAANYAIGDEFKVYREFGARHAVRTLKLPDDAFPVDVQLVYQVNPTPPPGGPPPDPMTPPTTSIIESFRFPNAREVQP